MKPACLGGWCRIRDACPNHVDGDRSVDPEEIADRLCKPNQDGYRKTERYETMSQIIQPSLRQRIWEFCRVARTLQEIHEHIKQQSRLNSTVTEMRAEGQLKSVARGQYIRTHNKPKGKGHGGGRGQVISLAGSRAQTGPVVPPKPVIQREPYCVMRKGGVTITIAPTPPGRFEVTGPIPRTFEFEFEASQRISA